MTSTLRRVLAPRSEYIGLSIYTFGAFSDFESCDPAYCKQIVRDAAELPTDVDFVYGHLQYQFTRKAYPEHRFLLLAREPRSRLVSLWLYWRSNTDEALAPWGQWGEWIKSARQDLTVFLEDPRAISATDNAAARLLLQPHPAVPDGELISEAAFPELRQELANILESIDLVGFTEDVGLTSEMERFLGQPIVNERANVTVIRDVDAGLDIQRQIGAVDRKWLDRLTSLDRFIWEYAVRKSGFAGDVDAFADACFNKTIAGYLAVSTGVDREQPIVTRAAVAGPRVAVWHKLWRWSACLFSARR